MKKIGMVLLMAAVLMTSGCLRDQEKDKDIPEIAQTEQVQTQDEATLQKAGTIGDAYKALNPTTPSSVTINKQLLTMKKFMAEMLLTNAKQEYATWCKANPVVLPNSSSNLKLTATFENVKTELATDLAILVPMIDKRNALVKDVSIKKESFDKAEKTFIDNATTENSNAYVAAKTTYLAAKKALSDFDKNFAVGSINNGFINKFGAPDKWEAKKADLLKQIKEVNAKIATRDALLAKISKAQADYDAAAKALEAAYPSVITKTP